MSIQALNWALSQDQITNASARFVLLVLCNYADENGRCYPSRQTIARKTSMSVRSVQNQLNWLSDNGYLKWENQHNDGNQQSSNIYKIPSAKFAPPRAESAHPPCKIRQKPSAESAPYTSVREPSIKQVDDVFVFWKNMSPFIKTGGRN